VSGGDRGGGVEQVGGDEIGIHRGGAEARRKAGDLTAKDAEGAKKKLEGHLGPSFAVKAPLIQDDSLKRGEFAPRSLFGPRINAKKRE